MRIPLIAGRGFQRLGEFAVQAAETAVAHHDYVVACVCIASDLGDQLPAKAFRLVRVRRHGHGEATREIEPRTERVAGGLRRGGSGSAGSFLGDA